MINKTTKAPRLIWSHAMRVNLMERVTKEFGTLDDWYENASGKTPRPKDWKAYGHFCEQYHRDSLAVQGKLTPVPAKYGGAVRNQIAWATTRQSNVARDASLTLFKMYSAAHEAGFLRLKHFPTLETSWE